MGLFQRPDLALVAIGILIGGIAVSAIYGLLPGVNASKKLRGT